MSRRSGEQGGAVARRDVPRGRRSPDVDTGDTSSTLDVDFAAAPPWSAWDLIPTDVRMALDRANLEPIAAFVAGASEPKIRKRGERFLERAAAWWVNRETLVLIDAVRDLRQLESGKFSPVQHWRVTARRHPFTGEVRERSGTVPVDGDFVAGGADLDKPQGWVNVIDLLPAPVRQQVITTVPRPEREHDFLSQGRDGKSIDHDAGLIRVVSRRMIAVSATRAVTVSRSTASREAGARLAAAPWEIATLTAQLGDAQVIELDIDDPPAEVGPPGRRALRASRHDTGLRS